MTRKEDFDEACTRLPELVERNVGAELLPSPEYKAVPTGSMAASLKSSDFSTVFLSVEATTVSWSLSSGISYPEPMPQKTLDRNKDIMSTIPFMTSTRANIEIYIEFFQAGIVQERNKSAKICQKKSQSISSQYFDSRNRARDETRTHTGFTPLAPETSASTISPPALEWTAKINKKTQNKNVRTFTTSHKSIIPHKECPDIPLTNRVPQTAVKSKRKKWISSTIFQ